MVRSKTNTNKIIKLSEPLRIHNLDTTFVYIYNLYKGTITKTKPLSEAYKISIKFWICDTHYHKNKLESCELKKTLKWNWSKKKVVGNQSNFLINATRKDNILEKTFSLLNLINWSIIGTISIAKKKKKSPLAFTSRLASCVASLG